VRFVSSGLIGGLFGALIVTGFATTVPVLGVTEATLIYILGSLGAALAIDGFGLLGAAAIPVSATRILGIALAVVGFLLARR
jgi:transporter family-2 protein